MRPILVNQATGRLYICPSGVSKRVDPTTFAVTANAFGEVVGVNPVTNRLYAVTGSTLLIIDGAPDPELILTTLPFTTIAGYHIGVNTALNRIYIFGNPPSYNTLYTIDGTTGTDLGSILLGTGVSIGNMAVDSTNGRIYIAAGTPSGRELFVLQDCQYVLAGDLNDDCRVDFFDFAAMAANWLVDCDVTPGDPACVPK